LTFDFLQFIIMLQHVMLQSDCMKVFIKKIIIQDLCFCSSAADVIICLLYDAAPEEWKTKYCHDL
jgi:uncharacterized membrane protein